MSQSKAFKEQGLLAMAIVGLAIASSAQGDVTIRSPGDLLQNVAFVQQLDYATNLVTYDDVDSAGSSTGVNWGSHVESTRNDNQGFIANAVSDASWMYGPSSPGLGNPFTTVSISGSSSLTAESLGVSSDIANTRFEMQLNVHVSSDTQWAFTGDILGNATRTGFADVMSAWKFDIFKLGSIFPEQIGDYGNGTFDTGSFQDTIDLGGMIETGDYVFILSMNLGAGFQQESLAGAASAGIELQNGLLTFVPAPGSLPVLGFGVCCVARRRRNT